MKTNEIDWNAKQVYAVLPASQAVRRGAALRRLLEDALLEMGFPLEELTHYDASSGRVVKIKKASDADAPDAAEVDAPIVEDKEVGCAGTVVHAKRAELERITLLISSFTFLRNMKRIVTRFEKNLMTKRLESSCWKRRRFRRENSCYLVLTAFFCRKCKLVLTKFLLVCFFLSGPY